MATEWEQAPEDVIELARELIESYHPHLGEARIGILFRSEAGTLNGGPVLGKAQKVTPRWLPLLKEPLDFVIWLAADWWLDELDSRQRRALLDHELCHCIWDDDRGWAMRGHDIEEFNDIIRRHGDWLPDRARTREAFLMSRLPLPVNGKVVAVDLESGESHHALDSMEIRAAKTNKVFTQQVLDEVAEQINDGALGPDTTAEVTRSAW